MQGVVILEVRIDVEGKVTDAKVLRGIPLLDQAALGAVKQWECVPTVFNGAAIPTVITQALRFTLPQPSVPAQ